MCFARPNHIEAAQVDAAGLQLAGERDDDVLVRDDIAGRLAVQHVCVLGEPEPADVVRSPVTAFDAHLGVAFQRLITAEDGVEMQALAVIDVGSFQGGVAVDFLGGIKFNE